MVDFDDEPGLSADAVGYGRPPLHSRFKPGRSGNPRGRPKAKKATEQIAIEVLGQKIWVTANGRRRRLTHEHAIMLRLREQALKGDLKAIRMLFDLKRGMAVALDAEASGEQLSQEDLAILADVGLIRSIKEEPDVGA